MIKRYPIFGVKYNKNNKVYKKSIYFYNKSDAEKLAKSLFEDSQNKNLSFEVFETTSRTLLNYYKEVEVLDSKKLFKKDEKYELMSKYGILNYKIYNSYNEFLKTTSSGGMENC